MHSVGLFVSHRLGLAGYCFCIHSFVRHQSFSLLAQKWMGNMLVIYGTECNKIQKYVLHTSLLSRVAITIVILA